MICAIDARTGQVKQSEDTLHSIRRPHACFSIQSLHDDLVNDGGIFDLG